MVNPLADIKVYDRVKDIITIFGKTKKPSSDANIWKKRSIFFDLPYWIDLNVRHCIDVMHVEKNNFDTLIGTLNIRGNTKDCLKCCLNLVDMGIGDQLHPISQGP